MANYRWLVVALLGVAPGVSAQEAIRTLVGTERAVSVRVDSGGGSSSGNPNGLTYHALGNLYVSDPSNSLVFQVNCE
jgi:hypothetical protein